MSLTDKQKKFVENILAGSEIHDAAKKAGYAEATIGGNVYKILESDEVRKKLEQGMAKKLYANRERLKALSDLAMEAIEELVKSEDTKETVRLNAAKTLLDRNEGMQERAGLDISGSVDHKHELDLDSLEDEEKEKLVESFSKMLANKGE